MTFALLRPSQKLIISALLLIGLSLCVTLAGGYSSDALYSYSQAKDLVQLRSLDGWVFSAVPFFAPDVLVALPFAAMTDQPTFFYLLTAPIQVAILVLALSSSLLRTRRLAIPDTILDLSISAALAALICSILFFPTGYFAIQPLFIFSAHGFAAICATAVFWIYGGDDFAALRARPLASMSAFTILTVSDFYFALYFGAILFTSLLFSRTKTQLASVVVCGMLSAGIFAISYYVNPSLGEHILESSRYPSEFGILGIAARALCLMTIPTACVLILHQQGRLTRDLLVLYVSLLLIGAMICLGGVLKDKYSFRYLSISYPVSIIFIFEVLTGAPDRHKFKLLAAVVGGIGGGLLYEILFRKSTALAIFEEEIACIQSTKSPAGSSIVAEYWPAKVVFEATKRNYNLLQVDAGLNERDWINNRRWRYLHQENADSKTFVLTHLIARQALDKIRALSYAHSFCNDKIIVVDKPLSQIGEIRGWSNSPARDQMRR